MTDVLTTQLPAITLAILITAAPLAFVANARGARVISLVAAVLELCTAAWLVHVVRTSGPLRYAVGGWGAPLGIEFRVDGLSAVLIALAACIGFAVTVYAAAYFGADEKYRHYWPLWLFLWGSLVALFSTNDAFNFYVCLELVSVSAVALVAVGGSRASLFAAMRYMLAAIAGSLFYLFGVAMLYGAAGALDFNSLAQVAGDSPAMRVGLGLAIVGLAVKTALFPMHFWLPPAHANAVAPVSAVLSALVVKGSFYGIFRLMVALDGGSLLRGLPLLLGALGASAIAWGSVQAFTQSRLKMVVAYSTVAQIGYLFVLFPLLNAATNSADAVTAMSAGVFHVVSHALAKGAMFLAAGTVLVRFGHDRVADLKGLARRAPALAFTFAIAGVSMLGLPPSGGFVSKWLYVSTAISSGVVWWAVPVLVGGLLAAAYMFRVVAVFLSEDDDADGQVALKNAPWATSMVPLALALLSLFVGVFGQPLLDLIEPAVRVLAAGVSL